MPATEDREVIVLWSDGMISIVYGPGGNVDVTVGGAPPQELADTLDAARALAEASVKAPAFREKYIAELEDLMRTHAHEIRKFCDEQVPARAA